MTESTRARTGATSISPRRLEDYALIGDTASAALVGRDGSIDWFCAPRFDSAACFASLLGTNDNGHWSIRPTGDHCRRPAAIRSETLILETEFQTPNGRVRLIDFMVPEHAMAPYRQNRRGS